MFITLVYLIYAEKGKEREKVEGGDGGQSFNFLEMQMWGLVTFTRDMVLAFCVRNFQETSNLMDVWTYG